MSLIKLKKLYWDTCFSYGYGNVLDFTESRVSQIVGPNGIGKSSIPLILEETLYGKNSKKVKKGDIPNRLLDEGYKIKLEFEIDNHEYVVLQDRGSNIKITLLKDEEDISSHTATNTLKQIEELMGMDFNVFPQLIYQNTSSSLRFLTETDSKRKEFLTNLFDYSEYTEKFAQFKAALKSEESDMSSLQGSLKVIEAWFSKHSSTSEDLLPVPSREDYSEDIKSLIEAYATQEQKIKAAAAVEKRIKEKETLTAKVAAINVSDIREALDKLPKEESPIEIYNEISVLESKASTHSTELRKLAKLDNKCPTCHQDIDADFKASLEKEHTDRIEEYKALIKERKEEADRRSNILSKRNGLMVDLESYNTLSEKLTLYSDLSPVDTDISSLEAQIKDAKDRVDELRKLEAANNKAISQAEFHNGTVEAYLAQKDEFVQKRDVLSKSLDELQDRVDYIKILRDTFGPSGLIAYKLESDVKELESYINEYLSELSDGRFTLEFVLEKDKLNVQITDNGRVIDIAPISSGELARVNIATLLGIRKLMSSISKNTVNVLFLDEVISVIDDLGKEKLIEVLNKEEYLNTFVVNHSWTHPLVRKIVIKQDEGLSYIDNND